MKRVLKIVIGLGLVAYAVYSGNYWFYLGLLPLIAGLTNFCPLDKLTGGCSGGSCCAPTQKSATNSSCCDSSATEAEKSSCCSSSDEKQEPQESKHQAPLGFSTNKIEILGTGCPNCIALEKNVKEALKQLGLNIPVEKVTDINEIMKYQVMSTPGLVINGKVVSTGKLLSTEEVKSLLKEFTNYKG